MKSEGNAQFVTIFVNSADQWHGRPLYAAILQVCQQLGLAGARGCRCAEGYGIHRQLHTTRLLDLSENLPVRIDIVDEAVRIGPLLPKLEEMINEGLVTISDVRTLRFRPESRS